MDSYVDILKHFKRGNNCHDNICNMYKKIFALNLSSYNEVERLKVIYSWLKKANKRYILYIKNFDDYI